MIAPGLSWAGVVRLGLVQCALGAIVVMTTSTLNRVMVVELALPAMLPGGLVALHYAMQVFRPRFGHLSDSGRRRTPSIVGGMIVLAIGGTLAAAAVAEMATHPGPAMAVAVLAYTLVGLGVGAAGTSLLVLLAKSVVPARRAAAATIVWTLMIAGFAVTAGVAGHLLEPYSPQRLVEVSLGVAVTALVVSLVALWNVERAGEPAATEAPRDAVPFRAALAQVWAEPASRRLALFIFVSMLAYGGQDLILDPYAGAVFGMSPGASTKLSGLQHAGVVAGMLLVAAIAGLAGGGDAALRRATVAGCLASALALVGLAVAGFVGPAWPLQATVFVLGVANGTYAIAAIGWMMALVGAGRVPREGVRMGLWGASQAIAFGAGGFLGAAASDLARALAASPVSAYAAVFAGEAALFVVAAALAARGGARRAAPAEAGTGAAWAHEGAS